MQEEEKTQVRLELATASKMVERHPNSAIMATLYCPNTTI